MDEQKPVMDYARQWPSRKLAMIDEIARGVGVALCCFSHFMLTVGICQLAMAFDQLLNSTTVELSGLRTPMMFVVIGTISCLVAFRLIRGVIPRDEM